MGQVDEMQQQSPFLPIQPAIKITRGGDAERQLAVYGPSDGVGQKITVIAQIGLTVTPVYVAGKVDHFAPVWRLAGYDHRNVSLAVFRFHVTELGWVNRKRRYKRGDRLHR